MRIAIAYLAGVAGAAITGVICGFAGAGLSGGLAAVSLAVGFALGILAFRSAPPAPREPMSCWGWVMFILFAAFVVRGFGWLVWEEGTHVRYLSPNNSGDLPIHLTYIHALAKGTPWWPVNPIYAGQPLHYPFGMDLFNALLVAVGLPVYRGLVVVGFIGSFASWAMLQRWGKSFMVAGFLFNGGLAALPFFFGFLLEDYQAPYAWKSIPLAILITQRGTLWAIPAGLALLLSWRSRFLTDDQSEDAWKLPGWLEWLIYASMPLFHFHTFIALSLFLACWFVGVAAARLKILKLVATSLLPATLLTVLVTGLFQPNPNKPPSSFGGTVTSDPHGFLQTVEQYSNEWLFHHNLPIWLKFGWMQDPTAPFAFWFVEFGILPILLAALLIRLWTLKAWRRPTDRIAFWFTVPALLLAMLTLNVMFARWDWDNTKLLIWSYFALLPYLYHYTIAPLSAAVRVPCLCLLFFSGAISVAGGIGPSFHGFNLIPRAELRDVDAMTQTIPMAEAFIAYPTQDHPLLIAGRTLSLGHPTHLWSYGVDASEREAIVRAILQGAPNWRELADSLQIRYLFWGRIEENAYPNSPKPWKNEARRVATSPSGEIFDLRSAPTSAL